MSVQTINIALPKELIKKIDKEAKNLYRNRSEFIREALLAQLNRMEKWNYIFKIGREAGKKAGIRNEEDVNRIVEEYRHGKKN